MYLGDDLWLGYQRVGYQPPNRAVSVPNTSRYTISSFMEENMEAVRPIRLFQKRSAVDNIPYGFTTYLSKERSLGVRHDRALNDLYLVALRSSAWAREDKRTRFLVDTTRPKASMSYNKDIKRTRYLIDTSSYNTPPPVTVSTQPILGSSDRERYLEIASLKQQAFDIECDIDTLSRKMADLQAELDHLRGLRAIAHTESEALAEGHIASTYSQEGTWGLHEQGLTSTNPVNVYHGVYDVYELDDVVVINIERVNEHVNQSLTNDIEHLSATAGDELEIVESYSLSRRSHTSSASSRSEAYGTALANEDYLVDIPASSDEDEWDCCESQVHGAEAEAPTDKGQESW